MLNDLNIGESPCGEPCVQVGTDGYLPRARKECRALIGQLKRVFGEPPCGARFYVKRSPHDFGEYLSVEIEYDEECVPAREYAFRVEANLPETWDDIAKQELGL